MNRLLIRLIGFALLLPALAQARVEAPDHVFYGNVTLFGQPAPAGSVIEVRRPDGSVIARYTLGRDTRLGGQYSLRVPMDTVDPRIEGRARPGDAVRVFVGPQLAAETSVGAVGVARRLDLDPQNLGTGPAVGIADASLLEGNSGSRTASLAVTMNTTSADAVTIDWNTVDGSATGGAACAAGVDFVAADSQLVIAAGQDDGQIDVIVCGDSLLEPTETFTVALTAIENGVFADAQATVTLQDDDNVPAITIANVRALEPATGSSVLVFRPQLSRSHDVAVSFAWTTQNINAFAGSDYLAASGTVTIAPGETTAQIALTVLADAVVEPDESFRIALSDPQNVVLSQDFAYASIVDPRFDPALETSPDDDVIGGPDGVPELTEPSALALTPDGAHAYATSESQDSVLHFVRDPGTGRLTFLHAYSTASAGFAAAKLDGPKDLKLSPDGSSVYVASAGDNAVAVLSRDPAGVLSFVANQVNGQTYPDAPGGQTAGLLGVSGLEVSPDGSHVYAAGTGANAIAVFRRDADTGLLHFIEAERNDTDDATDAGASVAGLSSPTAIVLSPDGAHLYVTARFGNAVVAFDRDSASGSASYGKLSFMAAYRNGLAGVSALGGAIDLAISTGGEHLYVAAESDNAVVLFTRGAGGTLAWTQAWRRNDPGIVGMSGPQGVAVAPDGREVFVSGYADGSLTAFDRHGASGALEVHQTVFDGEGGVEHLGGAGALAPSADNRHLYVVANTDNAIVLFRRLSWNTIFEDGFGD